MAKTRKQKLNLIRQEAERRGIPDTQKNRAEGMRRAKKNRTSRRSSK